MSKTFSPEDVLKILRACNHDGSCDKCPLARKSCENVNNELLAAGAIEELLAKLEEQRWIPVTERLPVVGEDALPMCDVPCVEVLVVIEGSSVATALYCDGDDFFDVQGDEIIPYRVMKWRPMPEVPGEEGV